MERVVVGISGASGMRLSCLCLEGIAQAGFAIDLVVTRSALRAATLELEQPFATAERFLASLSPQVQRQTTCHKADDIGASIASGTYASLGMLIVPCSMASVAAIAMGLSDNLLRRAADVTLKERRRLVLVPREAPFSTIHLRNLLTISETGGIILPPIPAWYLKPKSLDEIELHIAQRAMEALGIAVPAMQRWTEPLGVL